MRVWFWNTGHRVSSSLSLTDGSRESERDSYGFRSKEWRDKERVNSRFHLFSRQGPTVVWLELFTLNPC